MYHSQLRTDDFLTAKYWIWESSKGFGVTSSYLVSRIKYITNAFTVSHTSFKCQAWPLHITAVISPSLWFPPRTRLSLAKRLCARPLGRGENQYKIDSPFFAPILSGSVKQSNFRWHICVNWNCRVTTIHIAPVSQHVKEITRGTLDCC